MGVALVACLAFATQLMHLTVVRHVVCPEHGQMVHLSPGEAAAPSSRLQGDSDAALFSGNNEEHHHGHCSALLDSQAAVASAPPAPLTLLSWQLLERSAPLERVATSSDRYRLAPKNSPPA